MAVFPPYFIGACFTFVTAASKDLQSIMTTRFFAGFFCSAPVSNTGGVLGDIFPPAQRDRQLGSSCKTRRVERYDQFTGTQVPRQTVPTSCDAYLVFHVIVCSFRLWHRILVSRFPPSYHFGLTNHITMA